MERTPRRQACGELSQTSHGHASSPRTASHRLQGHGASQGWSSARQLLATAGNSPDLGCCDRPHCGPLSTPASPPATFPAEKPCTPPAVSPRPPTPSPPLMLALWAHQLPRGPPALLLERKAPSLAGRCPNTLGCGFKRSPWPCTRAFAPVAAPCLGPSARCARAPQDGARLSENHASAPSRGGPGSHAFYRQAGPHPRRHPSPSEQPSPHDIYTLG